MMDDLVTRFEADVLRLTRKLFTMLKPDGKAKRLALVERVTCALVNDSDPTLPVMSTGVVVLPGGCLVNEPGACDHDTGHDAYAADVLLTARSMMPSERHMLKLRRRRTREKLLQTRQAPCAATLVVVIGPATKRRWGAFVSPTEPVQHQLALAQ